MSDGCKLPYNGTWTFQMEVTKPKVPNSSPVPKAKEDVLSPTNWYFIPALKFNEVLNLMSASSFSVTPYFPPNSIFGNSKIT